MVGRGVGRKRGAGGRKDAGGRVTGGWWAGEWGGRVSGWVADNLN